MFAVVLFSESNEVEVIPSCWLSVDEKVAYWPPYKRTEKAKAAVLTVEEPDETWGEYLVKVIKKYGTYEAARQHLPKAMRKNSLTSEDEGAKRVRMPSTKLKELSPYLSKRGPLQKTVQNPVHNHSPSSSHLLFSPAICLRMKTQYLSTSSHQHRLHHQGPLPLCNLTGITSYYGHWRS
ncbi:hypothetical protein AALO_G00263540 [Alosa alosa]|uniref:Uncharacterized protein n=1 Tax=Alosa alosa TaxID=278164 RepID=A0AAV6FQ74_9TELE|nr:hypothetical protein AALO_G00263540 [Alosa alosa]